MENKQEFVNKAPTLYRTLAQKAQWYKDTMEEKFAEYHKQAEQEITDLLDQLPHGSGVNYNWTFDFEKSSGKKLVFYNRFDTMNESGMYGRVIDFKITITPSLTNNFEIRVTGNFGSDYDIRDMLDEWYSCF